MWEDRPVAALLQERPHRGHVGACQFDALTDELFGVREHVSDEAPVVFAVELLQRSVGGHWDL